MKALKDRLKGSGSSPGKKKPSGSSSRQSNEPEPSTPDRLVDEARAVADAPSLLDKVPNPGELEAPLLPNNVSDDNTLPRSGNPAKKVSKSIKKKSTSDLPLEEQLALAKQAVAHEKAGKRKLFHSLVKLANELRRTRSTATPLIEQQAYADRTWYEGGMWRAPEVLPSVQLTTTASHKTRQAISLSDLFFNLVIVTAFTRVGVAIGQQQSLFASSSSLFYFAVFWTVWSKEASYSTRFDTTDLSATVETLITCFCVLFASLSVQAPIYSEDGTRIMMMAAFVAALHCLLYVRVAVTTGRGNGSSDSGGASASASAGGNLTHHVMAYAIFNVVMTALETLVWCIGIFVFPTDWPYRWAIFLGGILLALRVPRAFMANDFHGACSKRSVLFILLLGFLLQSIVVVASEFFEYQTPTPEQYSFIGAACLMFFCIKLLYVDDSDTLAEDHALLVNRMAAFFFNIGQFCLLLSTTVMGSGLNLLTHSYMAATAALPDNGKNLVCGGFSAVLLSTFMIKSMHLKRVPADPRNQAMFVAAYVIQTLVLLAVVGISAVMCLGPLRENGFLYALMQNDIQLLFSLSGAALFVVLMSWLDEGVELMLYETAEDSREFRVNPFGFWFCLKPDVSDEEILLNEASDQSRASRSLSVLSPLLGSSVAQFKSEMGYDSLRDSVMVRKIEQAEV